MQLLVYFRGICTITLFLILFIDLSPRVQISYQVCAYSLFDSQCLRFHKKGATLIPILYFNGKTEPKKITLAPSRLL